jgi:hypothetical protein
MSHLETLQRYMPVAEKISAIVAEMMFDEFGLMPPEVYDLVRKRERVYLIGSFNNMMLRKKLSAYENKDVLRQLSNALSGMPVVCTKKAGLYYAFVLSGRPSLPKTIIFPGFGEVDIFRYGVGMQGEVKLHANEQQNVIIGAAQGAGKSTLLALITHQARAFGWKLYLFDPQSHTFNPDIWNKIAEAPVGGSQEDFRILLDRIEGELAERVALFRKVANGGIPPADIDAYNAVAEIPLERIGFVADEVNAVLGEKSLVRRLADILRQGRKWGLYVWLAGHNWRAEDVPRELSAMLQTRIALRVADDTSGGVVLDNRHWGKWVIGKPPGRGVLKTDRYTPMQFYRVTPEQEREWLATTQAPSPLTLLERKMVVYALAELGGAFKLRELAAAFDDQEATEWKVRKLAEKWEARGWLEAGRDAVSSRLISPKLADLAGFSLTGSQASQDLIGLSQASQGVSQLLTGITGA